MKLDLKLQKTLLTDMNTYYPRNVFFKKKEWQPLSFEEEVIPQLAYLEEKGLCTNVMKINMSGHVDYTSSKITARGINFINENESYSNILDIDIDRIRNSFIEYIKTSNIPPSEKETSIAKIKKLESNFLRDEIYSLVALGLNEIANIPSWLQKLDDLSSASENRIE